MEFIKRLGSVKHSKPSHSWAMLGRIGHTKSHKSKTIRAIIVREDQLNVNVNLNEGAST